MIEKTPQFFINCLWKNKYLILISVIITIIGTSYSTNFNNIYWKFVVVIFGVSVIPLLLISNVKIEKIVFVTILFFGSFLVIFSPVFDSLDEPAHYGRALYISEGNFKLYNDNDKLAISKDYDKLTKMTKYNGINRLDPKVNFFHSNLFSMKSDTSKKVESKIKATRSYSSFVYFPGAFGLWFGKIISNGNLGVMFYLGRFFNLLMYAIMAFFAIRIASKWKILLSVFAVQHFPIYLSASYNQDAFFYGLSLLIVAKYIQLFDKEETISYKDVVTISIMCGLMAFTKLPSIMLIGLMLFIPISRYESKKVYFSNFVAIFIIIIEGLLWSRHYSSIMPTDLPKSVNEAQQLQVILSQPLMFLKSLLSNSMKTVLQLKQYFTFGWSFKYSELAYILYLLFIGSVVFMYPIRLRHKIGNWFKLAIVGVSTGIILLTNIIMYISFTGVGETEIRGVQGRYFFGIFVLSIFVFNLSEKLFTVDEFGRQPYFNEEKYNRIVLFVSILFLVWMCTMRVGAYY